MNNILAYSLFIVVSGFLLAGCREKKSIEEEHMNHASMENMDMQNMIHLTKRDEQYANIAVDTVKEKPIGEYATILGTVRLDERRITAVTSRIGGRVDQLYAKNPQQQITKGQALYSLYSEQLLSDENEFLNALQQQSNFSTMKSSIDQLVESSKRKLFLWGLTGDQVTQLEISKTPSALMTFYSPVSGTVVELNVAEGQYVDMGTVVFKIADLSQLWIESQLYTSELKWLFENPAISAEFDGYAGKSFTLHPVFDNPTLEPNQKISLVRFEVHNPTMELKAGMMAYINVKRNERKTLVIPKSALVIGSMPSVWVKTGDGMYENRMVHLGIGNKREVEVLHGLEEGEVVVTSGTFLLNSAWILKNGSGMPGMEGMKM